jgi:hypothetical protein
MTTLVTIENASFQDFLLQDLDGNNFGIIGSLGRYRLHINYSESFNKVYHLIFNGDLFLIFALNINGEFATVSANGQPFVLLIRHDPTTSTNGSIQNLLKIVPQQNVFAIAPAYSYPIVPPGIFRLDFHP